MDNIIKQIDYWLKYDYDNKTDEYRKKYDLDCSLTGGNLYADMLISLWLPLRYTLMYCNSNIWQNIQPKRDLKKNKEFLEKLKDNIKDFIREDSLRSDLDTLFGLGRDRANVIILPYRRWNLLRAKEPYYDYFPHFLYDLLNTEEESFSKAIKEWIDREHLKVFFEGEIKKENLKDLWKSGSVMSHIPKEGFNPTELINNYIGILRERKQFFPED